MKCKHGYELCPGCYPEIGKLMNLESEAVSAFEAGWFAGARSMMGPWSGHHGTQIERDFREYLRAKDRRPAD